ncbi:MAG: TonB-dependent receptor [Colwellia sp.]
MIFSLGDNNSKKFRVNKLTAVLVGSLALLTATSSLAATSIEGRISDVQHKVFFQGAQVKIVELNLTTVSERDGSFKFSNLPEGEYTLVIKYQGAQNSSQKVKVVDGEIITKNVAIKANVSNVNADIETMIVRGQRSGQAGAFNRQRNSNKVLSVVSSDAIGQLPDQNAAEALQRMPGIFIERDQGEGRFVGIRGIDPKLNNVTINGLNVPSPESGIRSVALDVIPSELISSLEVSKTVTPDMDASAIGGSIEVKSLSAFDRSEKSYSFTAQASHNELVSKTSPKLSGSYTDIFDIGSSQLGVATAFSWFKRDFGSQNMETDGGWAKFEYEDLATGDDVEVFGAEEIEQRFYSITRERLGAALNIDLQTASNSKYYLRTLYSDFSDDEYRLRNQFKFDKGQIDLTTHTDTSADFYDGKIERDTKDRYEVQKILSLVTGGENQFNDWFIEYNVGYSKSSEKEPGRLDATFVGEGFDYGYANSGEIPTLTFNADSQDLNNFVLDEVVREDNLTEDEEVSFALDISKNFVWQNNNGEFKFGGKYRSREKFNHVDSRLYDGGFEDTEGDDILAEQFNSGTVDFNLGQFGQGISQGDLSSYVAANLDSFELNTLESDIESKASSYNSEEDILALYAMVTLDINDWNIVAGVRYEDTSFSTIGNKVELIVDDVTDEETVDISTWQGKKDYNHLFPSLNVRYNISDKLITRFAYTQTIARPGFSDTAAYQLIETEVSEDDGEMVTERKAEVGNPDLDPYESTNFDLTLEYYPEKIGILSAGFFYKDIDNYIVEQEVQDNGLWDGYEEVVQSVNGGSASLTGIELAWNKSFDFGLLLGANGTFIDADENLPNQADTVANFMVGFENNDVSLRLSSSYKSENFKSIDNDADVYQDAHMQIDFSGKYYVSDTVQLYFNVSNINDEPNYLYHGEEHYNYQYEEYGRTFELGITITSL